MDFYNFTYCRLWTQDDGKMVVSPYLSLFALIVFVAAASPLSCTSDRQTTLSLLGFFPCLRDTPASQLSHCDLMILGSVELAIEEINASPAGEYNCFRLNLTHNITNNVSQVSKARAVVE